MSLGTGDIGALARELHALQTAATAGAPSTETVNAVSLKIQPFWQTRPETWFTMIESQFATKNITADDTKYHHTVTALDRSVAEEISAFLCSPPSSDKFKA